jgi:hypothetical protein
MSQIKDAIPKGYVPKKEKNERKQWVLRCLPKRETKMGTKLPTIDGH